MADIPHHLFYADMKEDFIFWLMALEVSKWVKKELLFAWARVVDVKITRSDVERVYAGK